MGLKQEIFQTDSDEKVSFILVVHVIIQDIKFCILANYGIITLFEYNCLVRSVHACYYRNQYRYCSAITRSEGITFVFSECHVLSKQIGLLEQLDKLFFHF